MAASELKFESNDTRPMKLFFEDEGRFGRSNIISRCWSPKGARAVVQKQIVRQYTYAYASVCPETGESHSLVLSGSNTETMNFYLKDLSEIYNHYRIVLCTDNAGWHISSGLIVPENVVFLYLPPYSPQLNPVEHVWSTTKYGCLANWPAPDVDTLHDRVETELSLQSKNRAILSNHFRWARLETDTLLC